MIPWMLALYNWVSPSRKTILLSLNQWKISLKIRSIIEEHEDCKIIIKETGDLSGRQDHKIYVILKQSKTKNQLMFVDLEDKSQEEV